MQALSYDICKFIQQPYNIILQCLTIFLPKMILDKQIENDQRMVL